MGARHQPHSARSCELALRALGTARGRPGGGASCLVVGRPVWGALPPTTARPLGHAAGARYPLAVDAGGVGVATRHQPHSGRSCELALHAVGAARGRPGGAPLAYVWGVQGRALSNPRPLVLCSVLPGPLPTGCGCGGCGRWDLSPTSQGGLLRAGSARCGGGTRAPGGGAFCLCVGRPESGALPPPNARPLGRAARYPLASGAVCGPGGLAVLGTFPRCAVRRVLCALPGFAAPGGLCGLAPVLVPWLWLAACLSGVPHGPALVCRALSGPVALGAPVAFPVAVVPSCTPGAVAPSFTGWLRGPLGGRPRTRIIVLAAGPCRGKGAGRAPRRTCSVPRNVVVSGRSLRLRSPAACAAVVWRVWTLSLTRPVYSTVRLSTGGRPLYRGCFVWTPTPPLLGRRTPRPGPARVCVRALLGLVRRAGLPGAFWCASPFLWPLFVRPLPGLTCPVCGCCWVFSSFSLFSFPFLRPRHLLRSVFFSPGCLGPWRLAVLPPAPPPLFFPFLCAPAVSGVSCFPARGALGLGFLWSSAPAPFFMSFFVFPCFFPFFFFFVFFVVFVVFPFAPPCLLCSLASGPGCCGPWRSVVLPRGPPLHFVFLLPALVCRWCGSRAGLCVLGCGVCWCVLLWALCPGGGPCVLVLCCWVLPGCAHSVCVVACRVAVLWCVLCFAWCCVGCLCWAWFLFRAAAPCCRLLVPCRGPWLCSVLGCGAAFLWCAASFAACCSVCRVLLVVPCCFVRAGWCCVVLPVVAGCTLLGLVACRCFPLACDFAGAPAWPRGFLPCCVLWFAVAPRFPALCPMFCGAVLPCGAVLWRPAVRFSFAGGVGLCLFPVCTVPRCPARPVVRCRFGLRCCWCLVLWCVVVCCSVSLGVLR